jgi:hemoglobin
MTTAALEYAGSDYERIGGAVTVRRAVDRFYDLVLADAALAPYFTGVDLAQVKRHQVLMLTHVLGGPGDAPGYDLVAAHRRLRVAPADFDRVGLFLTGVLWELGAGPDIVIRIAETLTAVRDQIVTHPASHKRRIPLIGRLAKRGWFAAAMRRSRRG